MPNQEEEWLRRARELGGVDERGNLRLTGMCLIKEFDEPGRRIVVELITPMKAPVYSDALERATPPLRFSRSPDGMILIPGRWFLTVLEAIRDDDSRPEKERALARVARNIGRFADVKVPTSRVQMVRGLWRETGEEVEIEVLVPPVTMSGHLIGYA